MYLHTIVVKEVLEQKEINSYDSIWNLQMFLFSEMFTPDSLQLKTFILLTIINKKSLETEVLIAICRLFGDNCNQKYCF